MTEHPGAGPAAGAETRDPAPARPPVVEVVAGSARRPLAELRRLAIELSGAFPGERAAALAAGIESRVQDIVSLLSDAVEYERLAAGHADGNAVPFDLRSLLAGDVPAAGWPLETVLAADVPAMLAGDVARWREVLGIVRADLARVAATGALRLEVTRERETSAGVVIVFRFDARPSGPVDVRARESVARRLAGGGIHGGPCAEQLRADLARRIVAANGGTLRVVPADHDGIRLELHAPFGMRGTAGAPDAGAEPVSLRGARILLVGADQRHLARHAALLRHWGCEATTSSEGAAALHALRAGHDAGRPFAAALVTDDAGGMDGSMFGRLVRAHPELAELRLVRLAGIGVRGDSASARDIGFDGYLPEALPGRDLHDAMRELLRRTGVARDGLLTRHELAERRHERRRVLLAGLSNVDALVLAALLERRGFAARVVPTAPEAVEAWERERPDAAVVCVGDDESLVAAVALQVLMEQHGARPLLLVPAGGASLDGAIGDAGLRALVVPGGEPAALCARVEELLGVDGAPSPSTAPRTPGTIRVVSALDLAEDYPALSAARLRESSLGVPALERELMRTFERESASRIERIHGQLGAGSTEALLGEVIGLKGLAMTVGAYALGRVCAAIEGLVHAGRAAEVAPMVRRLASEAAAACDAMRELRESRPGDAADAA